MVATRFRDRIEAARLLARALDSYRETPCVVLGLPKGGAITAGVVADAIGAPCDLVVVKKLGYPHNPEYAVGAVTADGDIELDEAVAASLPEGYLEDEIDLKTREARELRDAMDCRRPVPDLKGKTAILVDDGIATGYTMKAAIRAIRKLDPAHIVVAAPVAPYDIFIDFHDDADAVVVPTTPEHFHAVGEFYEEFPQVNDEQVIEAMLRCRA